MARKARKNTGLIIGVVLVAAIIMGAILMFGGQTSQVIVPGTTTGCALSPVLTLTTVDALAKGTAVSPTYKASINGAASSAVTSGTTAFTVGDNVVIFATASDYLDNVMDSFTVGCGAMNKQMELYSASSDNPSVRIKNDDGDFMTDNAAGGATNQTVLSAGESFTVDYEISGTNLESSGDMVVVVELGSAANVTDVTMTGATKVAIPTIHTTLVAGSKVVAFEVPAVVGADKATYPITVSLTSGKIISGAVYTDVYAKQWFIDDDGSFQYGIQDSTGDAKYENTVDSDFFINAS